MRGLGRGKAPIGSVGWAIPHASCGEGALERHA